MSTAKAVYGYMLRKVRVPEGSEKVAVSEVAPTLDKEAFRDGINSASKSIHRNGAIIVSGIGMRDDANELWRVWAGLRAKYPRLKTYYSPATGVGVIMPGGKKLSGQYEDAETTPEQLRERRTVLMGPRMSIKMQRGHD